MQITVLASGSKANASVLHTPFGLVLIDAGLSSSQLEVRLKMAKIKPGDLRAIILTHDHADHTQGLETFVRKYPTEVFTNALTATALNLKGAAIPWRIFRTGQEFGLLGSLGVLPFPICHDAADPVGFKITTPEGLRFGYVTDLGCVTPFVRVAVADCSALFLEANYDEELLAQDRRRPAMVRLRTSAGNGHLSNAQAAELVRTTPALKRVILGHLSAHNNRPGLAQNAVLEACVDDAAPMDPRDIEVAVAFTPASERLKPPTTYALA